VELIRSGDFPWVSFAPFFFSLYILPMYCVHKDGSVTGFTECYLHTNRRAVVNVKG
jgi:hypothetical protein